VSRRAFVLGGSGQIGQAVAKNLIDSGWLVTIAHRGLHPLPRDLLECGATSVKLDRRSPGALARALGPGADALIDVIGFDDRDARQLLALQNDVGAFVVVSSSSVYRDAEGRTLDEAEENGFPRLPEPIPETQTTVAPGPKTYSTRKVALERALLHGAIVPTTILRPAAIHGVGSAHPREWWFVKRILDGRAAIPIAYRGESRFHSCAAANIAEATRVALEAPGTRVLNIADPSALSIAEIGAVIARHMGFGGQIIGLDGEEFPARIGRTPWSVLHPFVLDLGAVAALGYSPVTSYAESVGSVCDGLMETAANRNWREAFPQLAGYPHDQFDYAAEDAFLSALTPAGARSLWPSPRHPRRGR